MRSQPHPAPVGPSNLSLRHVMLVGGTLALLATPGPILQERAGEEAVVVEEDMHVVMVDTDE